MTINDISVLFSLFGFIFGLFAIILLFGIIKRTKDEMRHGFFLFLFAITTFVILEALKILEVYKIIPVVVLSELFILVFILFMIVGLWKLKSLIKGLSDFGQAFVITSENKHEDKLVSIVKDVKDVCYVTLKEPYKKVVDVLDMYNIDTSGIQFIDASGVSCDADNCININNNPDDIKNTLDRVLKEKGLRCVVIDDITELKNIESFELPLFIQDTSSLIKTNEAQGFFIGKMEHLGKETINDISMIVDKMIGEEK